jgi:ATP-dependent helicase YprA (DUF1998 family)
MVYMEERERVINSHQGREKQKGFWWRRKNAHATWLHSNVKIRRLSLQFIIEFRNQNKRICFILLYMN